VEILASQKFGVLMQNQFWRYFNLADCSLQYMKLCSFIILAAFKFGVMDPNRQIKVIAKISAYTVPSDCCIRVTVLLEYFDLLCWVTSKVGPKCSSCLTLEYPYFHNFMTTAGFAKI